MSLFDDIADMMARSYTAGTMNAREDILRALRKRYKTEAELRNAMGAFVAAVNHSLGTNMTLDEARAEPVTPLGPHFKCPKCGAVSHNKTDIEQGYCGVCHDWTEKKQ